VTDRRTDRHDDSTYHIGIASCGKNGPAAQLFVLHMLTISDLSAQMFGVKLILHYYEMLVLLVDEQLMFCLICRINFLCPSVRAYSAFLDPISAGDRIPVSSFYPS